MDVQAALDWRDFEVSNYSDKGAAKWLADRGITLLRGQGVLAGTGAVDVDGVRCTADQVILANGADRVVPPVPGLRELDGVWGTNEATGMKAVPKRLIVLGGGAAGVELAQIVRRLGGEVTLVEAAERVLAREPAPLGVALGEALAQDGIELALGVQAIEASRDGETFVLRLEDGRELRGDHLLVATGRRPRVEGIGLETVGITPDRRGVQVDSHMRAGERLWAVGDVTGIWQLTHVGEYQGEIAAANILGEAREAHYEAVPRVTYTDPQAAAVGATRGRVHCHRATRRDRQNPDVYARLREVERVPDAGERRGARYRRIRAGTGGRGVATADDAGYPSSRSARDTARHDPAVPQLLRDPDRRRQGDPTRDRRGTAQGRVGRDERDRGERD